MEYSVEYDEQNNIIMIEMSGRLNFQVAEKYSKEAIKLARQNKCNKFMFNHSRTNQVEGINQLYITGEELQQFGFLPTDRVAVIVDKRNIKDDLNNFTNYNSRSCEIKYFSNNLDVPLVWLTEK